VLFGSVFGLSQGHAVLAAAVSAGIVAALALIARPLLFATIDEAVARARGVPVTALGLAFLALAGVTAAEATQVVGALLLLGLIAAPAGVALRLTTRPNRAMWLSAALSVAAMWLGLTLSYAYPKLPPSLAVIAAASAVYLAATLRAQAAARTVM
jgi:zinc/manganese transport system permease protein